MRSAASALLRFAFPAMRLAVAAAFALSACVASAAPRRLQSVPVQRCAGNAAAGTQSCSWCVAGEPQAIFDLSWYINRTLSQTADYGFGDYGTSLFAFANAPCGFNLAAPNPLVRSAAARRTFERATSFVTHCLLPRAQPAVPTVYDRSRCLDSAFQPSSCMCHPQSPTSQCAVTGGDAPAFNSTWFVYPPLSTPQTRHAGLLLFPREPRSSAGPSSAAPPPRRPPARRA